MAFGMVFVGCCGVFQTMNSLDFYGGASPYSDRVRSPKHADNVLFKSSAVGGRPLEPLASARRR